MTKIRPVSLSRSLLVVWLGSFGLSSCLSSHSAWTEEDSWYTGYPADSTSYWTWQEIDQARIHQVIEIEEPQAEALLRESSALEISREDAEKMIGEALPEVPGTKIYLVRGVMLNRETGNFMVHHSEDQLLVRHVSMGRSAVPMRRQALVLQLEDAPTKVFVTCSMVE